MIEDTTKIRAYLTKLIETRTATYDEFMFKAANGNDNARKQAHLRYSCADSLYIGFKACLEIFIGEEMTSVMIDSIVSEMMDSGVVREGDDL